MRRLLSKFFSRVSDPVITDRSIDLLAAFQWFTFAGWGIWATLTGLPTIATVSTRLYEVLWGSSIAFSALIALGAVLSTFMNSSSIATRMFRKRVELVSVSLMAGFIVVYPAFILWRIITGELDLIGTLFVAVGYLGLPTWRAFHLYGRIQKLKAILTAKTQEMNL